MSTPHTLREWAEQMIDDWLAAEQKHIWRQKSPRRQAELDALEQMADDHRMAVERYIRQGRIG